MSRTATGDVVVVKPTNNVYTALVAIAVLAEIIAFFALYTRAAEIFIPGGKGLFG
jgi:hypothetical protein